MTTTTNAKFAFASETVNADFDILLLDIQEGQWTIDQMIEEAQNLAGGEVIHIVGPIPAARRAAAMLNDEYAEACLYAQRASERAREQVEVEIEAAHTQKEEKKMTNTTVETVATGNAARDFLAKQAAKIQGAKKETAPKETAPKETPQKEEKNMTTKSTKAPMGSGVNVKTKGAGTTRALKDVSVTVKPEMTPERAARAEKRNAKLGLVDASAQPKEKAPWYLDATRYPILNKFEDVLDAIEAGTSLSTELGIDSVRFAQPFAWQLAQDIVLIAEVKMGGLTVSLRIKDKMEIEAISCPNISLYTSRDGSVAMTYGTWKKEVVDGVEGDKFNFYPSRELRMSPETMAMVMALGHYAMNYEMNGLIQE